MHGLLINRKVLVKHNLKELLNISGTPPKTNDDIGIIFLMPISQYNDLLRNPNQLLYIQSKSFIQNIKGSYFIVYNKDKKICELRDNIDDKKYLKDIINSIGEYMPSDVIIWTGIIPVNMSESYIKAGFGNPHIVDHSPLKHSFNESGVAFLLKNNGEKVSETSTRNKLIHASTQSGKACNIYSRFTPEAVKYLQNINLNSSKELAGSLIVSNVNKYDEQLVFELSPDPSSSLEGNEEDVDAVWSRYNFHTHPKKAYENHGVTRGWPSSQDFVGFLQLKNHTIFHTVVTLEGIYVISLSPEWSGDINSINKKQILKQYDIDHRKKITFNKYVDMINNKKYKGVQLFVIKFLPWNNATVKFPVFYAKTGNKCLATEETFKIYKDV